MLINPILYDQEMETMSSILISWFDQKKYIKHYHYVKKKRKNLENWSMKLINEWS
jgi:hypothetical protein